MVNLTNYVNDQFAPLTAANFGASLASVSDGLGVTAANKYDLTNENSFVPAV